MDTPTLTVQVVKELVGWSALVTEDGVPVAGCYHRHKSTNAANLCGGRMARQIIVERAERES